MLLTLLVVLAGCGGGGWDENQAQKSEEKAEAADAVKAEAHRKQDFQLVRSRIQETDLLANKALVAIEELTAEVSEWNAFFPPLEHNDAGRALAANPNHVATYAAMKAKERLTLTDVDGFLQVVSGIREPLAEQLASDKPELTDELEARHRGKLERILAEATASRDEFRQDRELLRALLPRASPGAGTLTDVLSEERARRAEAEAERIGEVTAERERLEAEATAEEHRLRLLAFDSEVLALLDFGHQGGGYAWHVYRLGDAYRDEQKLKYYATVDHPGRPPITEGEYGRRDAVARAKYGMGLHGLYRLTCDYNRSIYLDELEIHELLKTATGDLRKRLELGPYGDLLPPEK